MNQAELLAGEVNGWVQTSDMSGRVPGWYYVSPSMDDTWSDIAGSEPDADCEEEPNADRAEEATADPVDFATDEIYETGGEHCVKYLAADMSTPPFVVQAAESTEIHEDPYAFWQ